MRTIAAALISNRDFTRYVGGRCPDKRSSLASHSIGVKMNRCRRGIVVLVAGPSDQIAAVGTVKITFRRVILLAFAVVANTAFRTVRIRISPTRTIGIADLASRHRALLANGRYDMGRQSCRQVPL